MLFLVLIIGYVALTVYLANQEELKRLKGTGEKFSRTAASPAQILLYIGIGMILMTGTYVLMLASSSEQLAQMAEESGDELAFPDIGMGSAVFLFAATLALGGVALAVVQSPRAREVLEILLEGRGRYDRRSVVHMTAVVMVLLLITGQIVTFILEGGTSGMAESIEEEGIPPGEVLFQMFIQVNIAFLGVGWAVRRNTAYALRRLGLPKPTRDDLVKGLQTGLLLIGAVFVVGIITSLLIQVGIFSEQSMTESGEASNSLTQEFATLPRALLLSISAAVGEEILFRGALQPVFGNILVSVFFTLMHTQTFVSPGLVLIFVVSFILGRLRERQNTVAAIIAHFTYNFVLLLYAILIASMETM